ncbi:MAG: sensor histidine kinase, partial [Mucilaginibacter sp.]
MKTQLTFRKKISALWGRLTGDPFDFTIEHRIFHAVCLIVVAAMAYFIPLNYFIGLPVAAYLCFAAAVVFFGFYYRSRVMGKMNGSIIACVLISNVFFFLNYFYNSGTRGPNDILFALSLFLIFSLSPPKQHKFWMAINITLLVVMHAIEYLYPRYVPNSYHTMGERIVDLTSAYVFAVIAMYFTIKHIRRNYDYEKNLVEEKKQAIEAQNEHILTQNEQLEQLNSEKNKLMSIIAHDLRGPLSNIQNYL